MTTNVDMRDNTLYVEDIKVGATKSSPNGSSVLASSGAQTISGQKTFSAGLNTKQAVTNVGDTTPTKAELTTAFGDPATLGRGFVGTVDDADGDTNGFIVWTSDANFYFLKGTKAT